MVEIERGAVVDHPELILPHQQVHVARRAVDIGDQRVEPDDGRCQFRRHPGVHCRVERERARQVSQPEIGPDAAPQDVLNLRVGLAAAELGVEHHDRGRRDRQIEGEREPGGDRLRHQRLGALPGTPEFDHERSSAVGIDHGREGSSLTERDGVAHAAHTRDQRTRFATRPAAHAATSPSADRREPDRHRPSPSTQVYTLPRNQAALAPLLKTGYCRLPPALSVRPRGGAREGGLLTKGRTTRLRFLVGLLVLLTAVVPGAVGAAPGQPAAGGAAEMLATPTSMGPATFRVYAHREGLVGHTTANGHVIQENDRFVALPCRCVLSSKGGHEFQVKIEYKGRTAIVPVWDVGPWNVDDNYWDPPEKRRYSDIPQGVPQAAAAYYDGHNGGRDGKGREVRSPAGIDIAD